MRMRREIVESKKPIKEENLSYPYTISLLREGFRIGLLNQKIINRVQEQIMEILKDLIMRYTNGESTSVKTDTAESILNSILYSLDAYLNKFPHPEERIAFLKTENIHKIYENGVKCVTTYLTETKALYEEIKKTKLDLPLEVYNASIDEDLPSFFQNYGIIFNAHDTMCTLDYPLIFDDMKIQGILYIKQYLEKLRIETQFCSFFRIKDVKSILMNYGRIYNIDYKTAPINIFEIVINNSIFAILSGNKADQLIISKYQYQMLTEELNHLNLTEIRSVIDEAFKKLIQDLNLNQSNLIDYIYHYQAIFLQRTLNAIENNCLHNLVITDPEENLLTDRIIFVPGCKMKDDNFRLVIRRILRSNSIGDKIDLITSNIPSLEDFIDILKANCLFGDEFLAVYDTLSDMELAILGKIVFFEELRSGQLNLTIIKDKKTEIEWHQYYIRYIKELSEERFKEIERSIMQLDDHSWQIC